MTKRNPSFKMKPQRGLLVPAGASNFSRMVLAVASRTALIGQPGWPVKSLATGHCAGPASYLGEDAL